MYRTSQILLLATPTQVVEKALLRFCRQHLGTAVGDVPTATTRPWHLGAVGFLHFASFVTKARTKGLAAGSLPEALAPNLGSRRDGAVQMERWVRTGSASL
jgi:hypothetical protein